jgi:uncharacterized membrane protein YdjX (TVP38/TMEM64 family)
MMSVVRFLAALPVIWQAILLTAIQTLLVMMVFPATPGNLASGTLFGPWVGSAVAIISLELSSILSFLIARYLARSWAAMQLNKRPKFQAVDAALARSALYVIFLIRVAPVFPYGLCSYLFGVTKVAFWPYLIATTAGMVPGTVACTYIGSLVHSLADELLITHNTRSEEWIIFACLSTIAALVFITLMTRRALRNAKILQNDGDYETEDVSHSGVDEMRVIELSFSNDKDSSKLSSGCNRTWTLNYPPVISRRFNPFPLRIPVTSPDDTELQILTAVEAAAVTETISPTITAANLLSDSNCDSHSTERKSSHVTTSPLHL